jgi:signal transduction histidine kinase
MRYAVLSTIAACLIGLLALLGLLQKIILTPLSQLTTHAVRIGQADDLSSRLGLERGDEIGVLASEWDAMLEKLEHSRRALAQSARAAGMSEIASGILHNVGNVLNSVNISASMVEQGVRELGQDDLDELARLLEENRDDLAQFVAEDPRGQYLQPYVSALAEQVRGQHGKILEELTSLSGGIEHIRELIRSQQEYAVRSDLVEAASLAEQFEQALSLTEKSLGVDRGLEIERRFEDDTTAVIDRHRVVEILVNLIQNARQSMGAAGVAPRRLTLGIEHPQEGRVRLLVQDNGVGIPAENLVRVFSVGFTTKKDGHGFGLHSSANTATALGGALSVESDGPGQGATFILEIPCRESRSHAGTHA